MKPSLKPPRRARHDAVPPARLAWESIVEASTEHEQRHPDLLWRRFKEAHGFAPEDFERQPPWCIAGAWNNKWAKAVFLGSDRRERNWAFAGHLDHPFDFAYLWLELSGFASLRSKGTLPYSVVKTTRELKAEAEELEKGFRRLSRQFTAWKFRGAIDFDRLVSEKDYGSTIVLSAGTAAFSAEQKHLACQVMRAGAYRSLQMGIGGQGSVLNRIAEAIAAWEPPEALVDRPHREGLRQRFAVRCLEKGLEAMGGALPGVAKRRLITELLLALSELGEWEEEAWTEERVRRCLDGKSSKKVRIASDG